MSVQYRQGRSAVEVRLPAVDRRHEAAEGEDRPRRGAPLPSPTAYDITAPIEKPPITVRDPADLPLGEQPVEKVGQRRVAAGEGDGIRVADPRHEVPVAPAGRDVGERGARGYPEQAALGVELVEQPVQVVLIGTAAVVEDKRAGGLARRLADPVDQPVAHPRRATRGLAIGVSTASISLALVLEERRQDQLLAQVLGVLVDAEAGAEGRDLEQHAARLAEVDRPKPEPVDHRRRAARRRRSRARASRGARPCATPTRCGGRVPAPSRPRSAGGSS